jgi:hypothetical protein
MALLTFGFLGQFLVYRTIFDFDQKGWLGWKSPVNFDQNDQKIDSTPIKKLVARIIIPQFLRNVNRIIFFNLTNLF